MSDSRLIPLRQNWITAADDNFDRASGVRGMRVTELLDPRAVSIQPPWSSFEQCVTGLVERLVQAERIPGALLQAAVDAVCEREAMASTSIVEIGVAIPHARLAGISGVVSAIVASPQPVYSAIADLPIYIVVLVLSAPDRAAQHLNALSAFSMLLQSEAFRRDLRHAPDDEAAFKLIRRQEGY